MRWIIATMTCLLALAHVPAASADVDSAMVDQCATYTSSTNTGCVHVSGTSVSFCVTEGQWDPHYYSYGCGGVDATNPGSAYFCFDNYASQPSQGCLL